LNLEVIKVLTFGKGTFKQSQKEQCIHLLGLGIDKLINLTDEDLPDSFRSQYAHILSHRKGFGYCIWKPYLILRELANLNESEMLLYIDCTDRPEARFFDFIQSYLTQKDILLLNRGYIHGEWTKRDAFVLMNCDSDEYHRSVQLEAGVIAMRRTAANIGLVEEWLSQCGNENILTEIPNICGLTDLPNFKEHRYDQSILTNLSISRNLESVRLSEDYIKYNYFQPASYT
jgi:hypothetical protein